jgi:MOB kinase activator 1
LLSLVYSMVAEYCTEHSCPVMNAGPLFEYKWADGKHYKQPTDVSAPTYVALLMAWVQSQLDDPKLFPTEPGVPFPSHFCDVVRNIFRRLFRVCALPARPDAITFRRPGRQPPLCAHQPRPVANPALSSSADAHVYYIHHDRVVELTFEAHLNSCFKHLMYFGNGRRPPAQSAQM